jgi:hypothetical protein
MTKTSMEDFFTRDVANEGIKLPLYTPTGEKTEHFLHIRGVDSDAFREADSKAKRAFFRISSLPQEEQDEALNHETMKLLSCLVISWSFDKECTQENVIEFLKTAPQIADSINQIAVKRKIFFAQRSSSSTSSQESNSSST